MQCGQKVILGFIWETVMEDCRYRRHVVGAYSAHANVICMRYGVNARRGGAHRCTRVVARSAAWARVYMCRIGVLCRRHSRHAGLANAAQHREYLLMARHTTYI